MKIYIGNMSFETTEENVRQAFKRFGDVASVNIITDRDTGRPKGFGFVEMSKDEEARAAIAGLNSTDMQGRTVNVNEARPRTDSGNRRSNHSNSSW